MTEKKIRIYFAKPGILMQDHEMKIKEAVEEATLNLRMRHRMKLSEPEFGVNGLYATVKIIFMDDSKVDPNDCNYGKRLRGISAWLLRKYPDIYRPLCVGQRLLYYFEEDQECQENQ